MALINDNEYGNVPGIFTRDGEAARYLRQYKVGNGGICPFACAGFYHSFGG